MTPETIASKLQERFGDKILETDLETTDPYCLVDAMSIAAVGAEYCRDELGFNYLRCLSWRGLHGQEEDD